MYLTLSRGVVSLRFERARAERDRNGTLRRVEMTFNALRGQPHSPAGH